MPNAALTALAVQALELALLLALPALLAALAASALMGIVQAATAVQDPSLAFVPRLVAVGGALWATGAAMGERLTRFASHVLAELSKLAL